MLSFIVCGVLTAFAYASDTVSIMEEPARMTLEILPEESFQVEPDHGEAPLYQDPADSETDVTSDSSEEGDSSSTDPSSVSQESSQNSSSPISEPSSAGSSESDGASSSQQNSAVSSKPESTAPSSKPESSSEAASSSRPESAEPSSKPSEPASSAPSSSTSSESTAPEEPSSTGETVRMMVNGTPQDMDVYEALCQVVEGEMGGSYHTEALKAQAVAAYSYIRYENARGAAASLPMRTPTQKTMDAVSAVLGQALYSGGSIAFTPYHASSAGYTNPASEVWSGSFSYLTRVVSAYDPSAANTNVRAVFSASHLQTRLESFLGITLDSEHPENWLTIDQVSQSGYVLAMTVTDANGGTHALTGRQLRENILSYGLRSHAFSFTVENGSFVFVTNGYGHGVGMSQTGAQGYATQEGWSYRQILSHYYPGTTLK